MKTILARIAQLLASSALVFSTAQAFELQFFGEDRGLGDHGGKLLVHPNSDAARNSFLAQLTGVGTENFESIPVYSGSPLALVFAGAGTATLTGSGEVMDDAFGPAFDPDPEPDNEWFGRFAISGRRYFGQVIAPGFEITFSNPVAAFGFYSTDIGDFSGTLTLTFEGAASKVVNFPNAITAGGSVAYFGYINTDQLFTKVTFGTSSASDSFGFDDLTIGSVNQVRPVPDSLNTLGVLLLVALNAIAFRRWKSSRVA